MLLITLTKISNGQQPPVATEQQRTEQSVKDKTQAADTNQTAKPPPAAIQDHGVAPSENSEAAKVSDPKKSDGIDWVTWIGAISAAITGIFTIVLGVSTIGLWRETKRLAGLSENQSQDTKASIAAATRSAEVAEKALNGLEGAIIRPSGMTFRYDEKGGEIAFCFRNFGRSAGVVEGVSVAVFITPANNPTNIQDKRLRPFMFREMVAEKENSETLIFSDDILRQYGALIDNAKIDLHFTVNSNWTSLLDQSRGGGERFIWSPKRRKFLSGIQLWDDPERFPPGQTRHQ